MQLLKEFLAQKQEIVRVTQQLLDAISCKDFEAYAYVINYTNLYIY